MYSDGEFLYDKASGTSELQSSYRQVRKMTSQQGSLRLPECQGEDKTRPLVRKCNNLRNIYRSWHISRFRSVALPSV